MAAGHGRCCGNERYLGYLYPAGVWSADAFALACSGSLLCFRVVWIETCPVLSIAGYVGLRRSLRLHVGYDGSLSVRWSVWRRCERGLGAFTARRGHPSIAEPSGESEICRSCELFHVVDVLSWAPCELTRGLPATSFERRGLAVHSELTVGISRCSLVGRPVKNGDAGMMRTPPGKLTESPTREPSSRRTRFTAAAATVHFSARAPPGDGRSVTHSG